MWLPLFSLTYQITKTGSLTTNTSGRQYYTVANLSSLNIDKIIASEGSMLEPSGYYKTLNFADSASEARYSVAYKSDKNLCLLINLSTVVTLNYIITIRYTKTS